MFLNNRRGINTPKSFYKAIIPTIAKADKNISEKGNYRQASLTNMMQKFSLLANWSQKSIKRIAYHDQVEFFPKSAGDST